ncbi:RNA-directed DNA polymerase, eukaryota, reverse transcriptase zinc-binding domain protein [Tanacetum coccineum]
MVLVSTRGICHIWRDGIGEFPFTYLGLAIGENMWRVNALGPVMEKIQKQSDIVKIDEEIDGEFSCACVEVLGDGRDIRFLVDRWVDNQRLYDRFPRIRDEWRWLLGEGGEFTVKELARLVGEKILQVENEAHEMLWNRLIPKKVSIFVCRALKGRLPVRVKLDRRGIDLDLVLFPCCNNIVETYVHSLVTCDLAMSVWDKIFNW